MTQFVSQKHPSDMRKQAVVVGSGPNGLAAAIRLAQSGLAVQVHEAASVPGGGARSGELTLPGFINDLGSAVHPLAVSSPFFSTLPLHDHGLEWVFPPIPLAHPLDDGSAVLLRPGMEDTAQNLDRSDRFAWSSVLRPLVRHWPKLADELLRPLRVPRHPVLLAGFGLDAIQPAASFARHAFRGERARALFAGSSAHSFLPLSAPLSSAYGLMLSASGHAVGWPVPKGGSQSIADALVSLLRSLGGEVVTNSRVASLGTLGSPDLTLCDVTPRQFLGMAGPRLSPSYRHELEKYRYGPGIFKVDWALREPIPWRSKDCLQAGTVHVGGTLAEIAAYEKSVAKGAPLDKPFIILAQPSLFDSTRAPAGQHTAWAYCHVPNGWPHSMLRQIEDQIERFAPGFRDCILARHTASPAEMQRWNENLVGGDINGGAADVTQFVLRPTWRRYRTSLDGVYLCSSSTPPTGGVHGMCGFYAAQWALEWLRSRES